MTPASTASALADERARLLFAIQLGALLAIAAGLAASCLPAQPPATAALVAGAGMLVALVWRHRRSALVAGCALLVLGGSVAGHWRLDALDSRALHGTPGAALEGTGYVLNAPRPSATGGFRFSLELPDGRIEVRSPGSPAVSVGGGVYVSGRLSELDPFESELLAADGIALALDADKVEPVPLGRAGLAGALDQIRRRGERSLERGTDPAAAALLRGFVLGQDENIAETVRDSFKRSGLAHILAVSGQNVILLALLASPLLALLGVPLRARYVLLVALIAIYVPVAGGGPSIVRAGAMGIAGLVAAMASRPSSRWYALALAAAFTLALDPRYVLDVGWQLSFAAVLGILLLARPLIEILTPASRQTGALGKALTEGAALTIAATIATAPLIAAHFETVSLTTLPANLVAAPAVAPAMWLGMSAAAIGQIPGAPVEALSWLGGNCAGFIGWVAQVFGGPGAQRPVAEPGPGVLIAIYAALAIAAASAIGSARRRRSALPSLRGAVVVGASKPIACAAAALLVLAGSALLIKGRPQSEATRVPPLRVNFLDVGQGDSILIRTRSGRSLLVDTGPPGSSAAQRLEQLGVAPLTALAITHDQSDHAGALPSILSGPGARRLVVSEGGVPEVCGRIICPPARDVSRGDRIRIGALGVRVLWPRPGVPAPDSDPNLRSLVLLVCYRRFRLLLTGDAEQGFAPVQPGNLDVLKVAHHGSEDPGLPELLNRSTPSLAVISVGAGNSYGHPTERTLEELRREDVSIERTDRDGEIEIKVFRSRWTLG